MQLILVTHGRSTTFKVGDIRVIVGHDQRAFKLTGIASVDAEIAAQLHRASHTFGNIHETAVAEHRGVERRGKVVADSDHTSQVLAHQIGMLFHRLAKGREYHTLLGQLLLEGGLHRNGVHHGIHCRAAQGKTLFQGNAQLIESLFQLGVDLLVLGFLGQRVGIIRNTLKIYLWQVKMPPFGNFQRLPIVESLQPEV